MADELLPYSLEAFAKGKEFPLRQLSLSISEPRAHNDYGYECIVRCPIVREKPMSIYSYEPLYAAELSIQFVKQVLKMRGIEVVDRNGRFFLSPRPISRVDIR